MRVIALVLAALLVSIALPLGVLTYDARRYFEHQTTVTRCVEDMPCWDCHTMGNRICGTRR